MTTAAAPRRVLLSLSALGLISALVGLRSGAMSLDTAAVFDALLAWLRGIDDGEAPTFVVAQLRLPRVLLGAAVGAALAVAGALMQALFRNPLADPAMLGLSSGGAFGASLAIVLGASATGSVGAMLGLPIAVVAGCFFALALLLRVDAWAKGSSVATLLLAGLALNALMSASTGLTLHLADDAQLRELTFWLLGSLSSASWTSLALLVPLLALALALLATCARSLDALLLGESAAGHLGVDVRRVRWRLLCATALLTGAAVAASGMVGFVGLVTPHIVRRIWGPGHRLLLPASALLGATLVVLADTATRTLTPPAEIPLGILTALLGAPVFLSLLLSGRITRGLT